ncbi:hypothetical protein H6F38_20060 [Paenibacillus sp. EKM208P]|nr:hypothetical protein H6F38_20060 [Paenibacillus sp. EKM208P]
MIPSRLFSINEQEELNAIYIIALLTYFDKKCDIQNLVYAFYLLKNGIFLDFSPTNKISEEFITNTVKRTLSYPTVISQPFKKGVGFLLHHKFITAKKNNNKLFYCINEEKTHNFLIPDKVDSRAQIVINQINEYGRDKLKILFRKQEHLYE